MLLKKKKLLELYVKKKNESTFQLHQSYAVCAKSGKLGPKRKQGDNQLPEGLYHIDRFNPSSVFYLSLGINYPNQSDRMKSKFSNLGGDIFIHGSCVTIGCLPMTDDKIKEIYLYAIHAKNNGQNKIPVYIFPFRLTAENIARYKPEINYDEEILSLWRNLKTGYGKFKNDKKELKYSIDKNGNYVF